MAHADRKVGLARQARLICLGGLGTKCLLSLYRICRGSHRNEPQGASRGGRYRHRVSMRRFYYAYPSLLRTTEEWTSAFAHCSTLGFDSVVLPLKGGDLFETCVGDGTALDTLLAQAARRDLSLVIDLRIDRVPSKSEVAQALELSRDRTPERDPRLPPIDRNLLPIPFDDDSKTGRWVDSVSRRLCELAGMGVAGFRCLHATDVPSQVWAQVIGRLRDPPEGTPRQVRFLAWPTRGGEQAGLRQAGLDAVFVPATALLGGSGLTGLESMIHGFRCVLGYAEAPFGPRTAQVRGDGAASKRQSNLALWASAALFDGILVPMGFEYGARERVPATGEARTTWSQLSSGRLADLTQEIADANAFLDRESGRFEGGDLYALAPQGTPVRIGVRVEDPSDADGGSARVVLFNRALDRSASVPAAGLAAAFGEFLPFRDVLRSEPNLEPDSTVRLRPAEVRVLEGRRSRPILSTERDMALPTPEEAVRAPRLTIEAMTPCVDGGRYAVRRIVGETLRVAVDAYGEGHDPIAVALKWRAADEEDWHEKRMRPIGNDRWEAELPLDRVGRYLYTIEAWRDEFTIFRSELVKKHEAGLSVPLELEEGRRLVLRVLDEASGDAARPLKFLADRLSQADQAGRLAILLSPETAQAMAAADPRSFRLCLEVPIPVESERKAAGFGSWYEMFPRSQSGDSSRHGTFDDVVRRLPAVREMGFDVVYFPPIHPIGETNRKGRNNNLKADPGDPGSPYAIGSKEGGHDAIHPELGTFDDFQRLIAEASKLGLEVALDFAIQVSPDHPWLKQHPEWFDWRPDGSIKYAENPPKKYEDIVNVDFYTEGAKPSLWVALRDVVKLWVDQGVKLFRVDNPHTKPFPLWEWLIADIRRDHPEVVFLAEAFTRPKVMYRLAKIGFSQSYTYFTWRNTKWELTEYLTELAKGAPRDFFRPHFFVNTPDINPDFLQSAPRPAFLIRAALATTLSGLWGMYNGFELCEGRPDAKKKEYAASEKYELRAWDWDRPGNIISEITALNRIRRDNPALHSHLGLTFHTAGNDNVLYFEKATAERDNVILAAISLDPFAPQEADIEVPLWEFGLPDHGTLAVEDLVRGHRFTWTGKRQHIRLDPGELPFSIWRLGRAGGF
jgi:starch synthase (maltosyl-transferring)